MSDTEDSINQGIIPRVAYLALGSNLGDRAWNVGEAIARLKADDRIRVTRVADVVETDPMYVTDQPEFLNTCLEIETTHEPVDLLAACLDIEREMGRVREQANGPRIIDIDVLLYEDLVTNKPGLTIPHPAMLERDFVMLPLAEIAGDVVHPRSGKTIAEEAARFR